MRSQVRILVRPLFPPNRRMDLDPCSPDGTRISQLGPVAQLGERLPCTQEVVGSIPIGSIKQIAAWRLKNQTGFRLGAGFFLD